MEDANYHVERQRSVRSFKLTSCPASARTFKTDEQWDLDATGKTPNTLLPEKSLASRRIRATTIISRQACTLWSKYSWLPILVNAESNRAIDRYYRECIGPQLQAYIFFRKILPTKFRQ